MDGKLFQVEEHVVFGTGKNFTTPTRLIRRSAQNFHVLTLTIITWYDMFERLIGFFTLKSNVENFHIQYS
jgi:hypothetical protein